MPRVVLHEASDFDLAYLGFPGAIVDDLLDFWKFCVKTMLWEISETLHPPCDLLNFLPPAGLEEVCLDHACYLLETERRAVYDARARRKQGRRRALALEMLVDYLRRALQGEPAIAPQICAEHQLIAPTRDLLDLGACHRRCLAPAGAAEA